MERINQHIKLGGEPINRLDIYVYDNLIDVKIWMTDNEMFDAFERGGADYERQILMQLRNKLFPQKMDNLIKFYDKSDLDSFQEKYADFKLNNWFNSTMFEISFNQEEDILQYIRQQFNDNFNQGMSSEFSNEYAQVMNF